MIARADTLDHRVIGSHVRADVNVRPTPRNGWTSSVQHIHGVVQDVKIYKVGAVRLVVDGVPVFIPAATPVKVDSALGFPDARPVRWRPGDAARQDDPDDDGTRVPVRSLDSSQYGMEVEFVFQGVRFFGRLTSASYVLGFVAITLDGTEKFAFDDDTTVVIRPASGDPAPVMASPAYTTEDTLDRPVTPVVVAETTVASWVPVPMDELEFA